MAVEIDLPADSVAPVVSAGPVAVFTVAFRGPVPSTDLSEPALAAFFAVLLETAVDARAAPFAAFAVEAEADPAGNS